MNLGSEQILKALHARGAEQQALFAMAREVRDAHFGRRALVRGVIEVTSACVKSCDYCPMRKEGDIERYFYRSETLLAAAARIREARLKVVFFQGGEVPKTTRTVGGVIPEVKRMFNGDVEVLLNLGDKPYEDYAYLKEQGADSYILKHETADPVLHYRRRHVTLEERLRCLRDLLSLGYRVGTGTIVGLPGQSLRSLVDDIFLPRELGAHMTSASPFIPAPGTPLAHEAAGDVNLALNVMALMRLVNPEALIPSVSALEKRRPGGQIQGFMAGANVITINFTPESGQANYPIYGKDRYVVKRDHAFRTLQDSGLEPGLAA